MSATQVSNLQVGKKVDACDFKLLYTDKAFQKIMYWVNKSNVEVSGFGALEHDEATNTFIVVDACILDEGTHGETEIDGGLFGKAVFWQKDHKYPAKLHWHSHHNMGAFWSGTDEDLIRGLGHNGWIFATVFNKKAEFKSAFCTMTEVMGKKHEIFMPDIKTDVHRLLDAEFIKICDEEYERAKAWGEERKKASRSTSTFRQTAWDDDDYWKHRGITPITQASREVEYDEWGMKYGATAQDFVYNPVRDQSIKSPAERWKAIMLLDPDEFGDLMKNDKAFKTYVDARRGNLVQGAWP